MENRSELVRSARSFAALLWAVARWQLVGAIAFATVLSLTEGVSVATVIPLIALFGDQAHPASVAGPHTRELFHLLTLAHIPRAGWLPAMLVVMLLSVGLLTQWTSMLSTLTTVIVARIQAGLAGMIFDSILHADWTFLVRRRASDLSHYLTAEIDRVAALSSSLIYVLSSGMVSALMLGLAIYISPILSLLVIACFGAMLPWQRRVGKRIYRSGNELSRRMLAVYNSSLERLQDLKIVKAHGAQDAELKLFTLRYAAVTEESLANQWLRNASARNFQLLSMAILVALILAGLGPLHLKPTAMLVFLFAFMRASPRLNTLQNTMNAIFTDLPAYGRILAFRDECKQNAEFGDLCAPSPQLDHALRVRDVTFAYSPGSRVILNGIDLTLPAGSITAIAGPSGCGKSTIADLVMGLLFPQQGAIESDGAPITRENSRSWRRHIGYVTQDTHLFHDSIRNNLLWAKPDASEAELLTAIKSSNAHFVETLSHGIDTIVGDRGMLLSHGQRQRIALARAMLLQPKLLILDEATNSLDLENEEDILNTVRRRGTEVTTLLISHRPSAVSLADRIYVLDGGEVTLYPTWSEAKQAVEAQAAELAVIPVPSASENLPY